MAMKEIALNVLDITQNSVTAGASVIRIGIDYLEDNMFTVYVKDNGCGMKEETVKRVIDPFYTTRTTRKVGLGIPFFKMAAEQTGGSFEITSEIGVGTSMLATFDGGNIDCLPLGDLDGVVSDLIMMNPDLDFVYKITKTGEEFILDTREFREVLGDEVLLSNPEIIQFIKEFIAENKI